MVYKRYELENLQERMNGLVFDIEYSMEAVKDLGTSERTSSCKSRKYWKEKNT